MSSYNATPAAALPAPDSVNMSPPLMPEQPLSNASSDASSYFEQQQAGGPLPVPAVVDGQEEVRDRAGPASFLQSAMSHAMPPQQQQHHGQPQQGQHAQAYGTQAPPPHGQQAYGGQQQPNKDYGKMAMDALGMVAAAKYGHGGGGHKKKHGSSAMLMSAGKMAYDMYNKKQHPQQPGGAAPAGPYGQQAPPQGYYGQAAPPAAGAYSPYAQAAPSAYGAPPSMGAPQPQYGGAPPPPQQPHASGGTGHYGLPGSHT